VIRFERAEAREEEGEMEKKEERKKKEEKKKENESRYEHYMNKPGNCIACVRISCKMASLLQGLDAIMFIQRAYIMLNDRVYMRVAVYTRIIALYLAETINEPAKRCGKRETRRSV